MIIFILCRKKIIHVAVRFIIAKCSGGSGRPTYTLTYGISSKLVK